MDHSSVQTQQMIGWNYSLENMTSWRTKLLSPHLNKVVTFLKDRSKYRYAGTFSFRLCVTKVRTEEKMKADSIGIIVRKVGEEDICSMQTKK